MIKKYYHNVCVIYSKLTAFQRVETVSYFCPYIFPTFYILFIDRKYVQ